MTFTPSAPVSDVGREIRVEMARHGYTQRNLAETLGLSQATISARMTGRTDFTVTEIRAVAAWLGVPVSRLLGEVAA